MMMRMIMKEKRDEEKEKRRWVNRGMEEMRE